MKLASFVWTPAAAVVVALSLSAYAPQDPAVGGASAPLSAPAAIAPTSPVQDPGVLLYPSVSTSSGAPTAAAFYQDVEGPGGARKRVPVVQGQSDAGPMGYVPGNQRPQSPGMEAYLKAETSDQKAAAREMLRRELEEQYDAFLGDREQEISHLEERIAKLREQLSRRRDAKGRMVELKLEMVISQADGLGWPDAAPGQIPADVFFGGRYQSTSDDWMRAYRSYHLVAPGQQSVPSLAVPPPSVPTKQIPRQPTEARPR